MRCRGLVLPLVVLLLAMGCVGSNPEVVGKRELAYRHPLPPGPPYPFYLTTFGAGSDAQNTSCGKWVDGSWWYATGVYHWGCGAKVAVRANGKCGVVEIADNGPADWVEQNAADKCGGAGGVIGGYILDVSPLLAKHLFGVSSGGWSDCYAVLVTPVDKGAPTGPCAEVEPSCGEGGMSFGDACAPSPLDQGLPARDSGPPVADSRAGQPDRATSDGPASRSDSGATRSDSTATSRDGAGPDARARQRDGASALDDSAANRRDGAVRRDGAASSGLQGGCSVADGGEAPLALLLVFVLAQLWLRSRAALRLPRLRSRAMPAETARPRNGKLCRRRAAPKARLGAGKR